VKAPRQYDIHQGRGNQFHVSVREGDNETLHTVEGIEAALTLVSQMIERHELPGMATGQPRQADGPADSKAVKPAEDGK
jgi:hypothetical protein